MKTNTTSKTGKLLLAAMCLTGLSLTTASADIGYQFVTVGNPSNAANTSVRKATDGTGIGGVGYIYQIGKYDVTLNQYTAFLNAVAATDTYNLYNPNMATDLNIAGIAQSGSSGSYSYSVIGDGNRPVTYVNWLGTARFANWMDNGQPTGSETAGVTETGAYTLNGDTTLSNETRNSNALVWLPSWDEWYKAGFYDPNKGGLGIGGYWSFATKSNSNPGNVVGSGLNEANGETFDGTNFILSVTQSTYISTQNYLTPVGAFTSSPSAYGTFDQSGNVSQWVDEPINNIGRMNLGYSWHNSPGGGLGSSTITPTFHSPMIGFRIAALPEPSTWAMLGAGTASLLALRRRKRPL